MAKVFDTFATLNEPEAGQQLPPNQFTGGEANTWIANYWNPRVGDKMFIASIPFLDRLFTNVNSVALRVVNIDNPDYVTADWIPYVGYPLQEDIGRDDVYYFVIKKSIYNGDAINLTSGSDVNAIIARLGKDEGKYFTIFYASNYELGSHGGTGNHSGAPGLKVPPGGG